MNKILLYFLLFVGIQSFSQELNCNLVINAQQTGNENFQVFTTLEKQLTEFVNNTTWTNKVFKPQERINCSMVITITNKSGDLYNGSIQVQSTRPVFGSTYSTPVYNVNDKNFSFRYQEFQNMVFNPNQFQSNLISVIAFHVYMILGVDADTFALKGGEVYFQQARTIVNYSQQEGFSGWKLEDGLQTRFALIETIQSQTYKEYRQVLYDYHREGMDQMYEDVKAAKKNVADAIIELEPMNNRRPNSYLMRTFFDAKADEIEQVFSDGPSVEITKLTSVLNKIAPIHAGKWRSIKF